MVAMLELRARASDRRVISLYMPDYFTCLQSTSIAIPFPLLHTNEISSEIMHLLIIGKLTLALFPVHQNCQQRVSRTHTVPVSGIISAYYSDCTHFNFYSDIP